MPIITFILRIIPSVVNLARRPLPADRRPPLLTRSILWQAAGQTFVLEVA